MFINFNDMMVNLDHVISIRKYEKTSIKIRHFEIPPYSTTLDFEDTETRDAAFRRISYAVDNRYLAIDLTSIKTKE